MSRARPASWPGNLIRRPETAPLYTSGPHIILLSIVGNRAMNAMLDQIEAGHATVASNSTRHHSVQPTPSPHGVPNVGADLRGALRRLAKAVAVVTCKQGGVRSAMAATAVSELSMDPPSLLVCVNKSASIFEPLSRAERFCVSILHHSHQWISENCSGAVKGEARFASGMWAETEDGVPFLRDAQACIFCCRVQRIDYGTHGVFLGRVVAAHTVGEVSPLIYVDGRYRK